jgi:signal transduction histidine kinase/CHASE2 domain-containing sensor protein/CheY-like chemotaxis protein
MPPPRLDGSLAISHGGTRARVVATLLGLVIILVADATPNGPLANLRNWVFDAYERSWRATRAEDRILVIDIDGDSIRHIGQWPWSRDQLARLVETAAAARVIGIDLLLTEPDRLAGSGHETDAILAASLRKVPVVLAAAADPADELRSQPMPAITPIFEAGDDPRAALPHYRSVAWPREAFTDAASGTGLITVPPEPDGVIRKMPTVASVGSVLVTSFGVEIVRVASRAGWIRLRAEWAGGYELEIGERVTHADKAGKVWPRYPVSPVVASVPAYRVLNGELDRAIFRDRVVLIGASAPGLGDAFETPLQRLESGVLIQAQLVDSLLAGDVLWRPAVAPALERVLAALLGIVAALQFGRVRDRVYILLSGGAGILLVAGSFGAFAAAGVLLDATLPVAALLGTNLIILAERMHREIRTRRKRENELANAMREAELRADAENARESLAIALDAAQMGMWDADLMRGTSRRSPRHDEIFGYAEPPPEWGRETLLAAVVAEDQDAVARSLDVAMGTGTLHFQCRIRRPEGALRSIAVDGRVYYGENGMPIRMAGVVTDVTERRRIEEALHQAQRLQTVGTIAGGIAHNFNNLLTIVLGNLDLASRQSSNAEELRRRLDAAAVAAERGANLTWQLLAFARQKPLRPEPIESSNQLRDLATLIGESLPVNVTSETDIPPDLWVVEIDRTELQFALLNLGFNARDALPRGGALRISARNQVIDDDRLGLAGRYVTIEIADNGSGIPPEILPRVFEPFVTTKEVGAGTGLGLSQVHGFVHQSGGAVDIESEPGRGTTVRMYLPAAATTFDTDAASPRPEGSYSAMGTVLVVEDQPDLASLAADLFGQLQLGIKVVHRASTALELLRAGQKVDLVFSDITMRDGMNGLELAQVIKTEFPRLPILLTSGYSDVAANAVTRGYQVIPKPYRMEELRMRLCELLGMHST